MNNNKKAKDIIALLNRMLAIIIVLIIAMLNINSLIMKICIVILSIIALINCYFRVKREIELHESNDDYQRLLDISPSGIIVYERDIIIYVNDALVRMLQVKNKEELIGSSILDILHLKNNHQHLVDIEEVLSGKEVTYEEAILGLVNKESVVVEVANLFTSYKGKKAVLAIIKDISDRKKIQSELFDAETRYRNIVEGALVGVYIVLDGKMVYVNKYFEDTFGYSSSEIYHMDFFDLVAEESKEMAYEIFRKLQISHHEIVCELKGRKRDGTEIYVQIHAKSTLYKGLPAIMGTLLDITERKKSEEKIREMALYDPVTSLPNRYFLNLHLKETLEQARISGQLVALMFLDFDRFKMINDTMGHSVGDLVLQQVSILIRKILNENDFFARYAGDEFIIVLKNFSHEKTKEVAEKIIHTFSDSINVNGRKINITPSIGISFYPDDSQDAETLIKYADIAMYEAKSLGRNNYKFYDQQMKNILPETTF